MWTYDKKLEYPIKIKKPDPKMAKNIITQYGGPDGELAASLRYLSQRFTMVTPEAKATLNDIGTEELAHLEMVGTMVKQLTENASIEEIKKAGLDAYYSDHDKAVYPVSASGVPFTAAYIQSKGDPMTDLYEDLAAEQKARSTYEYLINLAEDPDVIEPLKFLREREIVHFQRFGESLRLVQDYLENKKRFSIPKTFGTQIANIAPNRIAGANSEMAMPAMNMNMPGVRPAMPSGMGNMMPGPVNPNMPSARPTMPAGMGNMMPGPVNPNMPSARPTMPDGMGNMMPGPVNPNMPGTMPNANINMPPNMRDVQNMPGTPMMPRSPRDMGMPPKR